MIFQFAPFSSQFSERSFSFSFTILVTTQCFHLKERNVKNCVSDEIFRLLRLATHRIP